MGMTDKGIPYYVPDAAERDDASTPPVVLHDDVKALNSMPGGPRAVPVLPDKIPDTADGRAFFASLTDEQRRMYRPSVADGRLGGARLDRAARDFATECGLDLDDVARVRAEQFRAGPPDARTVLPGQPVRYHAATPSGSGRPPSTSPRGLRFADAATIRLALNAALLKPDLERASQLLTDEHRAKLETAIDAATVQPAECGHDDWEWPMSRCPTCGAEKR